MEQETKEIKAYDLYGGVYTTRAEIKSYYNLSNCKLQRLFDRSELEWIEEFGRRFYDYDKTVAYFQTAVYTDNRRKK
jgi:hypothetical protein